MIAVLRLLPELREVHLALEPSVASGRSTLYVRQSYETTTKPGDAFARVSVRTMLAEVWSSDASLLEIWEPLWMRWLAVHVAVVLTWRLSGIARRRHRYPVVTFAMENASMNALLGAGRRVPRWCERASATVMGWYVRGAIDRIVYATPAARDLYQAMPGAALVPSRLVLDLPAAGDPAPRGAGVVFAAQLAVHKGVNDLMVAWTEVEAFHPRTRLMMIGDGPLALRVAEWCRERPESRSYFGPLPRAQVIEAMRKAAVVVLPSRSRRRWREQVGLPIREALSAGRTVVTTDETGLASWLRDHGHRVVPGGDVSALAASLIDAIEQPLEPRDVLSSLPTVDSWRAAATAMYGGFIVWPER